MSTMVIDEFDFTGSEGAEVAKESNAGGGNFAREVEFLGLKADPVSVQQGLDSAIIRLVTEHERKPWMCNAAGDPISTPWSLPWITVKQHYAPTKAKPPYSKEGSTWPQKFYSVCRCDKVFTKKYNGDCYNCQQGVKASDRTWALAIEREQVIENGRVVGIRDKTREVFDRDEKGDLIVTATDSEGKKTYQMKTVPAWLVLNFGWKNFFGALNGQASYFKTVLGRDYVVTRTGMGNNDTSYSFVGLDPITITGEWASQLGVPEGTPYDLGYVVADDNGRSIPLSELLYADMPDLRRIVAERTSDDYYGRWFIPGWLPEGFDAAAAAAQGSQGGAVQGGVQQGYQSTQPQAPTVPQGAAPSAPAESAPAAGAPAAGATQNSLQALKDRINGAGK